MFVLQNTPLARIGFSDLAATPLRIETGTAKFDLTLTIEEKEAALKGEIEQKTDLYDEAAIVRINTQFAYRLESMVSDLRHRLSELSIWKDRKGEELIRDSEG